MAPVYSVRRADESTVRRGRHDGAYAGRDRHGGADARHGKAGHGLTRGMADVTRMTVRDRHGGADARHSSIGHDAQIWLSKKGLTRGMARHDTGQDQQGANLRDMARSMASVTQVWAVWPKACKVQERLSL